MARGFQNVVNNGLMVSLIVRYYPLFHITLCFCNDAQFFNDKKPILGFSDGFFKYTYNSAELGSHLTKGLE